MPATIFGNPAVAIGLYLAFYGRAPANATLLNNVALAAQSGPDALAAAIGGNFATTPAADLARLVLGNLGIANTTLEAALGQLFAVAPAGARGQIVLNLTNLLSGLESDATFAAAATFYNQTLAAHNAYASSASNTIDSAPVSLSGNAPVTGLSAAAVGLYQAFYGKASAHATYLSNLALAAQEGISALAAAVGRNFAAAPATDLARLVLGNLGLSNPGLETALGQMFSAYPLDARGQIVLNLTNLLAGLEADATYGSAAKSYQLTAAANATYSSSPANTVDSTPGSSPSPAPAPVPAPVPTPAPSPVADDPDTAAPLLQLAATSNNGTHVILTYNETLNATTAAPGAFVVTVGGVARAVDGVAVSGNTVVMTLASAVTTGQVVTVAYTDPTNANDVAAVQDAVGNDAASFEATAVANTVPAPPDTTAPVFQSAATSANGTSVILTYNEALSAITAPAGAFAVLVGGVPRMVDSVAVSGSTVVLTLASAVADGQAVTVAYSDPTAANDVGAVQDAAGNDAATLVATSVANNVPDTTPPLASAFSSTTTMLFATSNETGTLGLFAGDTLLARAGGGTLSASMTANVSTGVTVQAQLSVTTATLKVDDAAGNFAVDTRNVILGTTGNDSALVGTASADIIYGFGGADTITGGGGADTLYGGTGNDRFIYAEAQDLVSGAALVDRINGEAGTNALVIGNNVGTQNSFQITAATSWARMSNVSRIEAVGPFTAQYNLVFNDDAYESGLRVIDLSADTDGAINSNIIDVSAETGASKGYALIGSAGADFVTGGAGNDTINGGDGDDTFVYTDNVALRSDNSVAGGNGTDRIKFTTAIDTLTSGSVQGDNFHADFERVSGVEQVELYGASKVNLGDVFPTVGVNTVITGNDNTTLRYDNSVLGNITVDVAALVDNATLTLSGAADASVTSAFIVTNLQGDVSATDMSGNISVTAAAGSGFAVSVTGGSGNDTITGGAGADFITGGGGIDVINGGVGNDTYTYAAASESTINNVASLASGFDTVRITSGDIFDFAQDVTALRAEEYYVGQVPQINGDSLLVQLNSCYQSAGPVAGIDAMYISIGNNNRGRFLVIDTDNNNQITSGDLIVEIVGITNNKNIQLGLSGGNIVMTEVNPPAGP
jgi:uncharacterized repeat protein (TIGR02059 family)